MESNVTVYDGAPPALRPEAIKAQVTLIQDVMASVMRKDEHYGVIPGCGDKPTLLQPGAQKLIMTFRLVPDPEVEVIDLENPMVLGHREYRVKVKLSTQNGIFLGAGVGSCSTMEGKFRYRKADIVCPECGKAAIIKGKAEFGGGWICYEKKGGCKKKWTDAESPFGNITEKAEHDNPADYYNTCEKMAYKRALVSATLTVTAASDIFTQDVEDMPEVIPGASKKSDIKPPKAKSTEPIGEPDLQTDQAVIEKIEKKEGKTNNKAWTKYFITAGGEQYSTFDKTIAEAAKEYLDQELCLDYRQSKYGRELEALREPKAEGASA
uniref:Uncharacterized protein n=1 Tax=viral metagenome TaxID=1070528 RepID=A0A6M3L5H9_9ZZZZ